MRSTSSAGVVLWHVIYQAQIAVSAGFLEETWSRNLLSLMVSPVSEAEYLLGTGLFGLVKTVLGVGGVALIALICYGVRHHVARHRAHPGRRAAAAVGWVIAMLVIGIVLRYGSGAEALVWGILFVLMPLSATFFPVAALPGPLQPVAQALPTTHAFTAARMLVDGGAFPWHELFISAVLTLIGGAAAMYYVTSMLRLFRRRGYVTRYS